MFLFLESKTWLDSVKNLAEHLPDAANRLIPKNKKENMRPAETSGTAFINYVDVASADSGSDFSTCLILLLLYTPQEAHLFLTSYTVVFLLMEIGFKAIFLFFYKSFLSNN